MWWQLLLKNLETSLPDFEQDADFWNDLSAKAHQAVVDAAILPADPGEKAVKSLALLLMKLAILRKCCRRISTNNLGSVAIASLPRPPMPTLYYEDVDTWTELEAVGAIISKINVATSASELRIVLNLGHGKSTEVFSRLIGLTGESEAGTTKGSAQILRKFDAPADGDAGQFNQDLVTYLASI